MSTVGLPNLEKYYLSPGKYDAEFDRLLPRGGDMTLKERVERYGSPRSFRNAWYKIYRRNEAQIELFIRGDNSMVGRVDWNNLCHLFPLGWPGTEGGDLYYKEPGDYSPRDYLNIANRLWMINMYRH